MTAKQYKKLRKKLFGGSPSVMAHRLGLSLDGLMKKQSGQRRIARRDVRALELYAYMVYTAGKEGKTVDDAMRNAQAILAGILDEPYSEG